MDLTSRILSACDLMDSDPNTRLATRDQISILVCTPGEILLDTYVKDIRSSTSKIIKESRITRYLINGVSYFLIDLPGKIDVKLGTHFTGKLTSFNLFKVRNRAKLISILEHPDQMPLDEKDFVKRVWDCANMMEVYQEFSHEPNLLFKAQKIFLDKPIQIKDWKLEQFYPWQEQVFQEIQQPADDRHVIWCYDKTGNTGKSKFALHLMGLDYETKHSDYLVISQCGGLKDYATILQGALSFGWTSKAIIFDFSRELEDHKIFSPIEKTKDRVMNTIKYQGKPIVLPQYPHVYIFANFLPDVDKLSQDRWIFREITQEKKTFQEMEIEEVRKIYLQDFQAKEFKKRLNMKITNSENICNLITHSMIHGIIKWEELAELVKDLEPKERNKDGSLNL